MTRYTLGLVVAFGAMLVFPVAALADNCSSPGDCWRTGGAAAAAAAGAGAAAGAAAGGRGRYGSGEGDPEDPDAPPAESGDEPDDNPCD